MEFLLPGFSLLNANLRVNYTDTMLLVLQRLLKMFFVVLWFFMVPILRLRYFTKQEQLPPIQNKLLLLSAVEIARRLRRKEISCVEVIEAYVERCRAVNPILNAIVEDRFEAALHEAREVDSFLERTTKSEQELATEVPLLGVPVTVKESIAVKGLSYSVGVKKPQAEKALEDATVIKMIRKAGGIVLLVSNTPELCMYYETYNKVTGATCNPYDTRRTAGGSSGGEAALLGSGASLLSIASDIAGSARLPAMFCGVYGHKPSPGTIAYKGHKPEAIDKNWPSFFTISSMVRYPEDLPLLIKAVSQSEQVTERLAQKVSLKNINFFFLEDFGSIIEWPVHEDIKLAIHKVKKHMEITHHVKTQKADFSELKYAFNIASAQLMALKDFETVFSKEDNPKEWNNVPLEVLKFAFGTSPHILPPILLEAVRAVFNRFPRKYHKTIFEKCAALKKEYEELLGDNGVLIHPTFLTSAYYPYETYHYLGNYNFLMIYNALGYPVTQCPVGFNKDGLPIGLQIVTTPGCDHLTIAVAQEIEKVFGGWQEPPCRKTV